MKIRNKITTIFIVQFAIGLIAVGLWMGHSATGVINKNVSNQLASVAQARASHLNTYFEQNIERLRLITSRTVLKQRIGEYLQAPSAEKQAVLDSMLNDSKNSVKEYERVSMVGLDGKAFASTNDEYIGKDVGDYDFFLKGLETEGVYFVDYDGVWELFASGPVVIDGKTVAVGVAIVSLDTLKSIVQDRTGFGKTGEVITAFQNAQGERVYPIERLFENDAIPIAQQSEQTALPIKEALTGQSSIFTNVLDYRNKSVIAATQYVTIARLGLVAKMDISEALAEMYQLEFYFFIIGIILLILFYFLSYFLARSITNPIVKLQTGAKIVGSGDLEYKVAVDSKDEVGELSREFDQMTVQIKKSRAEIDQKVKKQTQEIIAKQTDMADQQKAILNILEDIDDEKRNIAEARAKDEAILSSIGDGVIVADKLGGILFINHAALDILKLGNVDITNKKVTDLVEMEKEDGTKIAFGDRPMTRVIENKKPIYGMLYYYLRSDKTKFPASVTVAPVYLDKEIIGVIEVFRDVSRERDIDKAKSEFVSLASHQLRTPLSTINWYTEMLLNGDAGPMNEEQKKFLDEIYHGNQRMVALVSALLNVSRLELGTFAIEPEEKSITEIADIVIKELQPQIKTKNLKFENYYSKDLKSMPLDPKLTDMIFLNLLSNAVKYTPEGGQVKLSIETNRAGVLITVIDTGYGIPQEQQKHIFTKLFRTDNAREHDADGTGLGLYIIKLIVDNIGGKIWFESVEDKGTTFFVQIPPNGMKQKSGNKHLD